MANGNDNPPPAADERQWNDLAHQRAAGREFLQAILNDATGALRNTVVTDRTAARTEFATKGKISIPNDVEVICIDATEASRKKVVVFILPENGTQMPSDLSVLPHWVAGWTPYSSARFKRNIQPMGDTSSAVLSLRPVTFRYKSELDPGDIPQFGLVAEEVEETNPDLVIRDGTGRPHGVRYDAVNAMLLNEFIRQHSKVERQAAMLTQQRRELDTLAAKIEKLSRTSRSKTKKLVVAGNDKPKR